MAISLCLTGCLSSRSTTGLNRVLKEKIGSSRRGVPAYRCTVGAHRGSSIKHLENTLEALNAAEADPAFAFVEFDVQYTKDRQIVLFHDLRMTRLFGRLTAIGSTEYAELVELTEGQIPLYHDAMDLLHKKVNLEIKSQGDDEEDRQLADEVIADLEARGRTPDVMISSISGEVIRYISDHYPHVRTGQIFWLTSSTYLHWELLTDGLYERFSESHADYILLHVSNLRNIDALLKLKPDGKTILFWDFDDRMYLVHMDASDRLWGTSALVNHWRQFLFNSGFTR